MSTLTVDNIVGATTAANVKLPEGCVLQTIQNVKTGSVTQNSGSSLTYLTVHSATITPKYSTSKILVRVSYGWGDSNASGGGFVPRFLRGSTTIADYNAFWRSNSSNAIYSFANHEFLDSPATTSATTYHFQVATQSGSDTIYYNPSYSGHTTQISTLTLMEIAQ